MLQNYADNSGNKCKQIEQLVQGYFHNDYI